MKTITFVCFILYSISILSSCKKKEQHNEPIPYLPFSVYVAEEDEGGISVIDPIENKVIGTINISEDHSSMALMPHNVQVAPDGKSIWVSAMAHEDGGMEQLIVLDPVNNHKIIKRIDIGTHQHLGHVVLDDQSNYAFVTAGDANQVIQVDAHSYNVVKRFDLGAAHGPHGLRYHNGKLYVANMEAKSMSIINIENGLITDVPLGGMGVQTAIGPDGQSVYVSLYDTKEVAKYDLQSQTLSKIALPAGALGPIQMYPTPDNKYLYICDQGAVEGDPISNKVYVLDIASSTINHTIIAGEATHGVVVSNDGQKAFVTNTLSNTVSIIDVASQSVTHTINVGKGPNGISFRYPSGGMK
ncbi:MAG TPA: YncE family protein [Edaphocola sp.]|nr:YncE family protein [Edaphocola sp.]